MRRLLGVLICSLALTGATAGTLQVIITGGRNVSSINYGNYPYTPTTNFEYNLRIAIPSLNHTTEVQRVSSARLSYGQVTNYVAGRIFDYAAVRGVNTNNLIIQFKRPQ